MKKILALSFVFGMNALIAQTNQPNQPGTIQTGTNPANSSSSNVPGSVQEKFNGENPNTKGTWHNEDGNYAVDYTDQSSNMGRSIYYDKSGNITRTDKEIDRTMYPNIINDYYTTTYPNEQYKIWLSEGADGNTLYYTKRDNKTIWFDKEGKPQDKQSDKNMNKNNKQKEN